MEDDHSLDVDVHPDPENPLLLASRQDQCSWQGQTDSKREASGWESDRSVDGLAHSSEDDDAGGAGARLTSNPDRGSLLDPVSGSDDVISSSDDADGDADADVDADGDADKDADAAADKMEVSSEGEGGANGRGAEGGRRRRRRGELPVDSDEERGVFAPLRRRGMVGMDEEFDRRGASESSESSSESEGSDSDGEEEETLGSSDTYDEDAFASGSGDGDRYDGVLAAHPSARVGGRLCSAGKDPRCREYDCGASGQCSSEEDQEADGEWRSDQCSEVCFPVSRTSKFQILFRTFIIGLLTKEVEKQTRIFEFSWK